MHPRTAATLAELERASWFSRVGVRDAETAVVVASWTEAVDQCSSADWENLCLEAANQLRQRILERSPKALEGWNELAVALKAVTQPLVRQKIESVVGVNHLPQVFEDTVQWDILHVCMEAEYADIVPPAFYASQAYWYVKGHFPCGWAGQFPEGKLIIY